MEIALRYIPVIAWLFVVLIVIVAFKGIKVNKGDFRLIKDWSNKDQWQGQMMTAKLISWKQARAMHNFDYFYTFVISCDLEGREKTYNAAGVVKISQAALLKKGQSVTIKYQGVPPKKIAIIGMDRYSSMDR
ncbi:hypothetical protein Z042_15550 [Chania multitudinisentens RB-25]|uniref:DUF3592 domain-containing protein n=1 Tax=Chania multitudinisentens RB-25 TaxID=1441930 RepID=W0LG04_9GAMM|nr:hypothetical protein [Chania multitudinisentens]AHG20860.1 hypothetical protein Z042_15550 [Chania multitudinisentens RB-25]